ncbi:MAG: tRNA (N(6)-L-threonylcarbamoyladenosine(37)-C(2))-methylthiotransferase MtaB [Ignavibacteria bacterium]|nr:tRNA (N(6)-L-threonylcarbamoyladenosine(37)-C(2))-methylthiotransferase MtaB [Ignavibacteria bacterium]
MKMSSKVAFHTLGCKLNFSETSTIGNQFIKNGFEIVDYNEIADVYVINTCTVTENADRECRQIVRRALRNNPNAYVLVTGCYAQLKPDEIASIEGVDAVLGSNEKFSLFSYINSFEKKNYSCVYVSETEELESFYSAQSSDADGRTRAFFKVQDGCDYKCSFCTIPLARGKSRSMNPNEVVQQFTQLLKQGYKEIILTGVNVGDYFYSKNTDNSTSLDVENKFQPDYDLYQLLQSMVMIEGDFRIRISSIEPNLLTDEIIDLAISDERLCNHFHIPLQSGSNNILKLMQRRYKAEDYKELILKLTSSIKNVGIGVDVIVGFPGETEDDFLETYNLLRDLPISYLHVFTYSKRPNTKAVDLSGEVNVNERKKRNNMLRILSEKKRQDFYRKMIGEKVKVLFEDENLGGFMKGFSSNYVRVKYTFREELLNQFASVIIKEVDENICTVEIL